MASKGRRSRSFLPPATSGDRAARAELPEVEHTLPNLPIPGFVMLPACTAALHIGLPELLRQVQLTRHNHGLACLVEAGHYQSGGPLVGCLVQITQVVRQATGWTVHFRGLQRLSILLELQTDQGPLVHCRERPALEWTSGEPPIFPELPEPIASFRQRMSPGPWLDVAALHLAIDVELRQRLLAEDDPNLRALWLSQAARIEPATRTCYHN